MSMDLFMKLDSLEYPINKYLQNLDGSMLDGFFHSVSNIPLMLATFAVIIFALILRKQKIWRPLLFAVILAGIVSYVVNEWIYKILFSEIGIFRPRPWTIHTDLLAIGHAFQDSSFPSSHMAFTSLFVLIISYFEKRFLTFGIIIILIMWISRIHNGMHYPSDVIFWTIMGALYAWIGLFLMKKWGIEKRHWWEKIMK